MEKTFKILKKYICVSCDFECSQKCDINRHNLTAKHKKRCNSDNLEQKDIKNFVCKKCGKSYNARNSLWYHSQKCFSVEEKKPTNEVIALLIDRQAKSDEIIELLKDDNNEIKELFLKLYNDNNELMKASQEQNKLIIELTKNGININNTNCNNKTTFNLNFFLNDTCKNAMNLSDFINSVKLNYQDFINVGTVGYVQGITNIVVKNVSNLSEIERPIHCTDEKRGTIYIKDDDKWAKDEEHKKLNKFILTVANKNAREMTSFKKEFPDCIKSRSIHSDKYNKSLVEAMGGAGDNDDEKNDKIKKNILKSIIIKTK
jgi:hypothetical protein